MLTHVWKALFGPNTGKREFALMLAIPYMASWIVVIWLAWSRNDPAPLVEMTQISIWPVLAFAAAAMGMQWAATQTNLGKMPGPKDAGPVPKD